MLIRTWVFFKFLFFFCYHVFICFEKNDAYRGLYMEEVSAVKVLESKVNNLVKDNKALSYELRDLKRDYEVLKNKKKKKKNNKSSRRKAKQNVLVHNKDIQANLLSALDVVKEKLKTVKPSVERVLLNKSRHYLAKRVKTVSLNISNKTKKKTLGSSAKNRKYNRAVKYSYFLYLVRGDSNLKISFSQGYIVVSKKLNKIGPLGYAQYESYYDLSSPDYRLHEYSFCKAVSEMDTEGVNFLVEEFSSLAKEELLKYVKDLLSFYQRYPVDLDKLKR